MSKLSLWTMSKTAGPPANGDEHLISGVWRDELWNEKQVAAYLHLAPKTLRAWRASKRVILPFVKLNGRMVRYRRSEVEAFVTRSSRTSTSEEGSS